MASHLKTSLQAPLEVCGVPPSSAKIFWPSSWLPPPSTLLCPHGASLCALRVSSQGMERDGGTLPPAPPKPEVLQLPEHADHWNPKPLLPRCLPVAGSHPGPPWRPRRRGWRDSCPASLYGAQGSADVMPRALGSWAGVSPCTRARSHAPGTSCTFAVPRKTMTAVTTVTGKAPHCMCGPPTPFLPPEGDGLS